MFDAIAQNKEKINQRIDRETDGWISDLVGSLTDPIIVMPGGWGDDSS